MSDPIIAIRGIRQQIPSGYLLGRTQPGTGQPHLISLRELSTAVKSQPFFKEGLSPSVSSLLDSLGGVQGDILYRGASAWTVLAPGSSGQVLQTNGAAANPSWVTLPSGSVVGFAPFAYTPGVHPSLLSATNTLSLAVSGGSLMMPLLVPAPMALDTLAIRNRAGASLRTAEWRLYLDAANASATAGEVSGVNGTFNFTPAGADNRTSQIGSPPVNVSPGLYWLVIRNTSASQTFDLGYNATFNPLTTQTGQTKTLGSALGSTLDLITGWTDVGNGGLFPNFISGRVLGQTTAWPIT